jgi:DNA invertase Pin-like site-specific DNA recombinase
MKRIPEEMENLILEMLQQGKTYKAIVARTGVSESTVGRVARDNGICRIKRDIENEENNYPQELMEEWDRVRLETLAKG